MSRVPQVAFSHRAWPHVLTPCASIRRSERCRHIVLVFSGGAR